MALPKNDITVNVDSKGFSFRFPANVLASEVYTMLITTDGPGVLLEPNGTIIVNKNSPVPAGNYTYIVRSPEVVPQVTAERDPPLKRAKVADAVESSFDRLLEPPEKLPSTKGESLLKGEKLYAQLAYFERLLQPPEKLPDSDADLKRFLSSVPVKLPILSEEIFYQVRDPELVTLERSEVTEGLAWNVEVTVTNLVRNASKSNEADSSADLRLATGEFLQVLNNFAPRARQLSRLDGFLDSSNLTTSKSSSKPLLQSRRPDYSLYMNDCLILRWENKSDAGDLSAARIENILKLKKWIPLYYGELPYVIGGACAGRKFNWLPLFSTGESLDYEIISPRYDMTKAGGVVALLLSTIRMHCLLQKLQEKSDGNPSPRLYEPIKRRNGSTVAFFPDEVKKVVQLDNERFNQLVSLYKAVDGSLYVIHQKSMKKTSRGTTIVLHPVGYPKATPLNLKEVEDATHDILHGLNDFHRAGFTHRDIRWENIVKVPIEGKWKYVIIDLEGGVEG